MHPIVDDVSPVPTEDIVASARCALRLGIVDKFRKWFEDEGTTGIDPNVAADEAEIADLELRYGKTTAQGYKDYVGVAIAYDFDFELEEHNNADTGFGFRLPFSHSAIGVDASTNLHKSRTGKRTFKSQDTVGQLLTRYW